MIFDKTGEIKLKYFADSGARLSNYIAPRDYKRLYLLNYFTDFFANHYNLFSKHCPHELLKKQMDFLWSNGLWGAGVSLYIQYLKNNSSIIPLKRTEFSQFLPVAQSKQNFFAYTKDILNALKKGDRLWSVSSDFNKITRHPDCKILNFEDAFKDFINGGDKSVFILDTADDVPVVRDFYIHNSSLYQFIAHGQCSQIQELLMLSHSHYKKIKKILENHFNNKNEGSSKPKLVSLQKIYLMCCLMEIKEFRASLFFSDDDKNFFFNLAKIDFSNLSLKESIWVTYKTVLSSGQLFDFKSN